jgi:hypothetical protein
MRTGLISGHNVDRVDVEAGLKELKNCGYNEPETLVVIEYALNRWKRGEEAAAEKGATDKTFHGIDPICWARVIASAISAAQPVSA